MQKYITEKNGTRRKAEEYKCESCGEVFLRRMGVNKDRRKAEFCSVKCSSFSRQNKVELVCHNCGDVFFRAISKVKNSRHGFYFCSRKCKDKSQRLDGNCKEIRPQHYGTGSGDWTYRRWFEKQEVKKCASCPEDKKYLLQVHHMDGNRKNFEESNYEIVCCNCHYKRHLKLVDGEWKFSTRSLTPRERLGEV